MTAILVAQLLAATAFAAVHLFSPRLAFLDKVPRSRLLSAAGGVSLAYVFVHLLPELAERQATAVTGAARLLRAETELFLVALAGLVVFYGLERLVARARGGKRPEDAPAPAAVFWIHIASFALYNALIGYLLVRREEAGWASLATYALAMALHFAVNDRGLFAHHGARHLAAGRWLLAGAVYLGLAAGLATSVPELALALLFAFLAGGIVLNVMKEELPEERESAFWALAAGAAGYAALLTAI